MKRLLFVVIAALGLASCGNKSSGVVIQRSSSAQGTTRSTSSAPVAAPAPAPVVAPVAPTAQALHLKVAQCNAEDHPFGKGVAAFKDKVEQLSNGGIEVELFNGTMSTEEIDLQNKMIAGEASCVVVSPNLIPIPEVGIFTLEYLFDNFNHWATCLDGNFGKELATLITEKTNNQFHILGYWSAGVRDYYGKKPIKEPKDLEGVGIRISSTPSVVQFWEACGATAKSVGWGALYDALNNGEVDAAENDYTSFMLKKHHTTPNGHYICETEHDFTTRFFMMDGNVFNSFTPEEQSYITQAAQYATQIERQSSFELASTSKAQVIADGAEVVDSFDIDQDAFREIAYPIQDQFAKENGLESFIQMVRDAK